MFDLVTKVYEVLWHLSHPVVDSLTVVCEILWDLNDECSMVDFMITVYEVLGET